MSDTEDPKLVERLFRALCDRTRLRLLNLMADQEVCVCYFVEILNLPQPAISRHLAYLRRAGLVSARREGKWKHYRIELPGNPYARKLLSDTLHWLATDRQMQDDRWLLSKTCCAPQKFTQLLISPAKDPVHPSKRRKGTHALRASSGPQGLRRT